MTRPRPGEWVSTSLPYLSPETGAADVWQAEAAARGGTGRQRIVAAGEVPASAEVAALLGLDEGEPVVVRRRLMFLDEVPCEVTDSFYPVRIARGTALAGTAKIRGGALALLADLGHVGVRAREDVRAALADEEECETLQLGPGEAVLKLARVLLDAEERPFQADLITMPARVQRLRYDIRIG
ncbi:GntR family transcriptional regulator [Streptomyces physcomitrii]|uniref:UTRA domain-containing protein n=1 Tax=Streptomyces physcomitrii TaxID=2724184 RepID=A0ABX1H3D5_9ACTN|nr:UTRA domain-containing protein [Streptomyces physcomitrii]NKI42562.1 UTRA domain-containing protein [Streptomyces physcomitrii]